MVRKVLLEFDYLLGQAQLLCQEEVIFKLVSPRQELQRENLDFDRV